MGIRPQDHAARYRVWLLDLTWGDLTLNLCGGDVEVFTDGTTYYPGLSAPDEIERDENVVVPLGLHLEGMVDVPLRVSQGHRIEAARAVLWLWLRETSHRERIADGFIENAEYGAADEPIACELVDDRVRNDALFPDANARMSSSKQNPGEFYPWVFGAPGVSASPALGVHGSSALVWRVDGASPPAAEFLMVAGHELSATTVVVTNMDTTHTSTRTVTTAQDSSGRTVSVVDLTSASPVAAWAAANRVASARYFVRWTDNAIPIRNESTNGAGDVLRWAMEKTDVDYDAGALSAILVELNRYKVGGSINAAPDERVDLWQWVNDHLLPILPLVIVQSDLGIRFVFVRWDAAASDAVAHIEDGVNCERVGGVAYGSREEVINEIRLSWGRDHANGTHAFVAVVTGDEQTLSNDSTAVPHRDCRASNLAHGLLMWEGSSDVIYTQETADLVARNKAREKALQPRFLGFIVPPDVGAHIDAGDIVTVTSADLHISAAVFMVADKPASDGEFYGLKLREITAGR